MKFKFYIDGKKKKQQVIKIKSNDDLMTIAKIVKCELTKNAILKDLDFSTYGKLMCIVKDKVFTMKELWEYLERKLNVSDNSKSSKKDKKKDKKKSSVAGKNTKKESKKKDKKKKVKKKKETKEKNQDKKQIKKSNGLVHITRR